MPAIRRWEPCMASVWGLGGLSQTDKWSASAVSCSRRRKASGVRPGGAPAHQFVSCMFAVSAALLVGQRRFVWQREAAECF
jgi:hypothetical protein